MKHVYTDRDGKHRLRLAVLDILKNAEWSLETERQFKIEHTDRGPTAVPNGVEIKIILSEEEITKLKGGPFGPSDLSAAPTT